MPCPSYTMLPTQIQDSAVKNLPAVRSISFRLDLSRLARTENSPRDRADPTSNPSVEDFAALLRYDHYVILAIPLATVGRFAGCGDLDLESIASERDAYRPMIASLSAESTPSVREIEARLRPLDILMLSAWCGLAGGLLEVGARIVGTTYFSSDRLYRMSRHFVWLAPLSNLLLFLVMGVILALAAKRWPRFGRWLGPRLIGFLAILPVFILLCPRIYPAAWAIFSLGAALCLVSFLEQHATGLRRRLLLSFPGLLGLALVLAGWVGGGEWLADWREASRPLPPGDAPNVLLITLDTVGADHLSLYGYERPHVSGTRKAGQPGHSL